LAITGKKRGGSHNSTEPLVMKRGEKKKHSGLATRRLAEAVPTLGENAVSLCKSNKKRKRPSTARGEKKGERRSQKRKKGRFRGQGGSSLKTGKKKSVVAEERRKS